jgi:hypothetical protein
MAYANQWPQVGDPCIDLRVASRPWQFDSVSSETTVKAITQTLVITSTGDRYHRSTMTPVSEGSGSARRLVHPSDPRVLCARGHVALVALARQIDNMASVHRTDPFDYAGAFAQVISSAAMARTDFIALTSAASRAEQESRR